MANLTVPIPDLFVPRIQASFGKLRGLKDGNGDPRSATASEVIEEVRQYMKGVVIDQETTKNVPADTGI